MKGEIVCYQGNVNSKTLNILSPISPFQTSLDTIVSSLAFSVKGRRSSVPNKDITLRPIKTPNLPWVSLGVLRSTYQKPKTKQKDTLLVRKLLRSKRCQPIVLRFLKTNILSKPTPIMSVF